MLITLRFYVVPARLRQRVLELEALLANESSSPESSNKDSMPLPDTDHISRQAVDGTSPHAEAPVTVDSETLRRKVQVSASPPYPSCHQSEHIHVRRKL